MTTLMEVTANVAEDSPFFVMFQVRGIAGTAINQASISAIEAKVYDRSSTSPDTAIQTVSLTVASVVFDTYQTDSRWTRDTIGYNLGHAVPAAWVPEGGRRYDIEYRVTPLSGDKRHLPKAKIKTVPYSSS